MARACMHAQEGAGAGAGGREARRQRLHAPGALHNRDPGFMCSTSRLILPDAIASSQIAASVTSRKG